MSHVDTHATVVQKFRTDKPAFRMQVENLGLRRFRESASDDVLRHAAGCIAAHRGFRTVGIENSHLEIDAVRGRLRSGADPGLVEHEATVGVHRGHDYNAVGTDTEATVAELLYTLFKAVAIIRRLPRFQEHKIVAETGPFREFCHYIPI